MRKKLLLILLLQLGVISMGYAKNEDSSAEDIKLQQLKYGTNLISVGNINTSINEKIIVKPDTATFSVTYLAQGSIPNEASNENTKVMKQLTDYLTKLGIPQKNLTTIEYRSFEQESQQPIKDENQKYRSTFKIKSDIQDKIFFDVVAILDKHHIDNITQDNYNHYHFEIQQIADTAEQAKQQTQKEYQQISEKLKSIGVDNFTITAYDNEKITSGREIVKKYFVTNTLSIKVNDFSLLNKIIGKAQDLKMRVNNDINYSVSNEKKDQIIQENEQNIYKKLVARATRLLGEQYELGYATFLQSTENHNFYNRPIHYPRADMMLASADMDTSDHSVDIQPPSEFEIDLTMNGTFEILKKIK